MPGKIWKTHLDNLEIKFIFRHKWDSPEDSFVHDHEYRTKILGLFFKQKRVVGTKYKGKSIFKKDNLSSVYMFGIYLIYAKCWMEIGRRTHTFTTQKNIINRIPDDGC
jgi:hypothetical protein